MSLSKEFEERANATDEAGKASCTRGLDMGARWYRSESRAWTCAAELVRPLEAELAECRAKLAEAEQTTPLDEEDAKAIAGVVHRYTRYEAGIAAGVAELKRRQAARGQFSVGDRVRLDLSASAQAWEVTEGPQMMAKIIPTVGGIVVGRWKKVSDLHSIPAEPELPTCKPTCRASVRTNEDTEAPWECRIGGGRVYMLQDRLHCLKCGVELAAPPTPE